MAEFTKDQMYDFNLLKSNNPTQYGDQQLKKLYVGDGWVDHGTKGLELVNDDQGSTCFKYIRVPTNVGKDGIGTVEAYFRPCSDGTITVTVKRIDSKVMRTVVMSGLIGRRNNHCGIELRDEIEMVCNITDMACALVSAVNRFKKNH